MDSSQKAESFRGVLLRHRGRTGLSQRELAARIGVSLRSLQGWEAGAKFPNVERLQALIRGLLGAGGLSAGREIVEAHELWAAAQREAPRMHAGFDLQWFTALLAAHAPPVSQPEGLTAHIVPAPPSPHRADRAQDWGEAPDTVSFVGRAAELELLGHWVLEDRCRLVALLGFGGIGKTMLAARLAQHAALSFERVYWRSLRNAPPVSEWLAGAISFLSGQRLVPPNSESERFSVLFQLLRGTRCLLVLDNSETLLESGQHEGRYRTGMDGYGRLFQSIGEISHQSCLVLTSREAPPELAMLGTAGRWLELRGLGTAEAQALVADMHLSGDAAAWATLVDCYSGNGLALKIISETIRQVYAGDVAAFLADASAMDSAVFGGIRRLLDAQAERLSPLERDILTRLAIEREPINLAELSRDMLPSIGRSAVVEAVENLRRRSLLERRQGRATFTLQSMVLEYVTDRLVETVASEVGLVEPAVLVQQPLIKAQVKEFVRQTQERLIGAPILRRLSSPHGESETELRLSTLLDRWRGRPAAEQGYGPGNVVNLLRLQRGDLRNMDLSHLHLRQVYLQGVDAQDARLEGAHLAETVLGEAFAYSTSIALSTDGATLVAGTPTGEVRLWRVADRTLLMSAQGHADMVWSVALSGDGKLIASGGADGMVRLSEATGLLRATLAGHIGMVRGVALSADGRLAATGGSDNDGSIRLWDTSAGGRLLASLQGGKGTVWSVALSADGRLVAAGGVDGTLRVWDTRTFQLVASPRANDAVVFDVALSADGGLLASGGVDGTVRLWDAATGQARADFQEQTNLVRCVALSGKGDLVASGHNDGTVRVWESASGRVLASLAAHVGVVWGVTFSGDARLLASAGDDGMIRLWDTASAQLLSTLEGDNSLIYGVGLSEDGRLAASGGTDRTVQAWDALSGEFLTALPGHSGVVYGTVLSGNGRLAATCGLDGTVRLWEVAGGRQLTVLQENSVGVRAVALSRDERLLIGGGADGVVRVWDAGSGQRVATLLGHTGVVLAVAVSADGRLVASGSDDGTVALWDVATEHALARLQGHSAAVRAVALNADCRLLASAGVDGTVRLWGTDTSELIATLEGHVGAVHAIAVSKNGRLVASGGIDGTVRLWETGQSQHRAVLRGHRGAVWSVALSGDGQVVASGGDDGVLRVWDADSGACRYALRRDRHYERLDITRLTGVNWAQRAALLALGAIEQVSAGDL